ncbi:hypothetical protein GCM10009839_43780 [Catenulispora yoronensis]|uniref:Uncharacterized protein n=1 Tax=Catenulispora yoronensis TaxID=450799 RepID=A0ABN2UHB2_9ACTN
MTPIHCSLGQGIDQIAKRRSMPQPDTNLPEPVKRLVDGFWHGKREPVTLGEIHSVGVKDSQAK